MMSGMSGPDTLAHYLLRGVNKAQRQYGLFEDGDRVLVAVSGGKDSLALLDLLYRRRVTGPEQLHLIAGHVRSDYHCGRCVSEDWLASWCQERNIPLFVEAVQVATRVNGSPRGHCFWCARERRKALFQLARREGCSKLAFGHHADDIAETTLMNLLYSGRVDTMRARSPLFDGELIVVRPLALIEERDIAAFARASAYPLAGEPCPEGAHSRRSFVKHVLREAEDQHHGVKRSIHRALRGLELAEPGTGCILPGDEPSSEEGG